VSGFEYKRPKDEY